MSWLPKRGSHSTCIDCIRQPTSGQSEITLAKLWALNFTLLKDDAKLWTFRKEEGGNAESEMLELVCDMLDFSLLFQNNKPASHVLDLLS